jgi:hypothetical protein
MGSSHASQVGRNRAAQYHRTMNPAPLRLRKAPERVWRLRKTPPEQVYAHLLTVARPTAPVIARDCCQDRCQRGNRFWTPSDGNRTAPQVNAELGQHWTARPVLRSRVVPATRPIRWSVRDRHGHSRTDRQVCRPGFQHVALIAETTLIRKRSRDRD